MKTLLHSPTNSLGEAEEQHKRNKDGQLNLDKHHEHLTSADTVVTTKGKNTACMMRGKNSSSHTPRR